MSSNPKTKSIEYSDSETNHSNARIYKTNRPQSSKQSSKNAAHLLAQV